MLSDFKVKLPTVEALEDALRSYTGFVILLKCIWFSSQSTNRNAKTSYRKKTHVTSLKGITCEARECIRTPVSVDRLTLVKCPTLCIWPAKHRNTVRMIHRTEGHLKDPISSSGELNASYPKNIDQNCIYSQILIFKTVGLLCASRSRLVGGRKVVFTGEPLLRIICYIPI